MNKTKYSPISISISIDYYRVITLFDWILQKRYSKNECCDVRSNNDYICLSIIQHDDLKW
jgi:hypothetical protein